jgi:hypothetical protein
MYAKPIVESILKTVQDMEAGVEVAAATSSNVSALSEGSRERLSIIAASARENPALTEVADKLLHALNASR